MTVGSQKSYIVATKPEEGKPGFICEYNNKQVGDLCRCASQNKLQREDIQMLRVAVLQKFQGLCLRCKLEPSQRKTHTSI